MSSYCLPTQGLRAGGSTHVDLKCNHVLTQQTETILDYRQINASKPSASSHSYSQCAQQCNRNSYYNTFSTHDSCLPFGRPLSYPFIHAEIHP